MSSVEWSMTPGKTNRDWLNSLSNEDLAAFFTTGLMRYQVVDKDTTICWSLSLNDLLHRWTSSEEGIKQWLKLPCEWN